MGSLTGVYGVWYGGRGLQRARRIGLGALRGPDGTLYVCRRDVQQGSVLFKASTRTIGRIT